MSAVPHFSKPRGVSHFLFLKDLIAGVDPRTKAPKIDYFCSRIENIKSHLKIKYGLRFNEDATSWGVYTPYKPYILIDDKENMRLAHSLLDMYGTDEVKKFLGLESPKDESQKRGN